MQRRGYLGTETGGKNHLREQAYIMREREHPSQLPWESRKYSVEGPQGLSAPTKGVENEGK